MNARTGKKLRATKMEKNVYPQRRGRMRGTVRETIRDTHKRDWVRQEQHLEEVDDGKYIAFFEAERMLSWMNE
jgi:hypothetical protein